MLCYVTELDLEYWWQLKNYLKCYKFEYKSFENCIFTCLIAILILQTFSSLFLTGLYNSWGQQSACSEHWMGHVDTDWCWSGLSHSKHIFKFAEYNKLFFMSESVLPLSYSFLIKLLSWLICTYPVAYSWGRYFSLLYFITWTCRFWYYFHMMSIRTVSHQRQTYHYHIC